MHTNNAYGYTYRICVRICVCTYIFGILSVKVPVYFCMESVSMFLLLYRKCSSDYIQLIDTAFKQLSSGQ